MTEVFGVEVLVITAFLRSLKVDMLAFISI